MRAYPESFQDRILAPPVRFRKARHRSGDWIRVRFLYTQQNGLNLADLNHGLQFHSNCQTVRQGHVPVSYTHLECSPRQQAVRRIQGENAQAVRAMKIAIGCDEAAYELKVVLEEYLDKKKIEWKDFGAQKGEKVLYPDVAERVCMAILSKECERGILVCGTCLLYTSRCV